jgi:23S rRNA G2445 N2-methylase RlmL
MALMFQRLARNFVKAGYFPTDEDTLARVLSMLEPSAQGSMRIIDPCAGEGVALAECRQHLGPGRTEAFGVEFDAERAWHAKGLLNRVIHGDYQETVITPKSFGLLWLNPPYGDLVSDKGATGDGTKGR